MAGPSYVASAAVTVTNLHSLATSADWTAGWFSASISNLVNKYLDYYYGIKLTTHASNRQAGTINIYVVSSLNDTPTWPSSATGTPGTEGAGSFTDAEERDAACRLICSITVDSSASSVIEVPQFSLVGGLGLIMPPTHHCLFISQNCTSTSAGLAASGNAVYQTAIAAP